MKKGDVVKITSASIIAGRWAGRIGIIERIPDKAPYHCTLRLIMIHDAPYQLTHGHLFVERSCLEVLV